MTAALMGLTWAGVVLVAAARMGPMGARARIKVEALPHADLAHRRSPMAAVVSAVGGLLLRAAGRPPSPELSMRLGRTALATMVTLAVLVAAAPAVAALVWFAPAYAERRRRHRARAALVRDLPEVSDLFVLAVGAGLTVPLAVDAVARRAPGALGDELRWVIGETALGLRLSDALEVVPERVGDDARPLIAALVASERYGAPLLDGLERLGGELRDARRRRAEEAARRVPVKLLFPLVFCTLPAFALLTVAPLLAGALGALRL